MKLVASMVVKNEADRYLAPCVAHLLDFCDEVAILDDGSDEPVWDTLSELIAPLDGRVFVYRQVESGFFTHEGETRQQLLDLTLEREPTHILAIDADEFVTDGNAILEAIAGDGELWTLEMNEVWKQSDDGCLCIRWDGGWRPSKSPILYRVPDTITEEFRIRHTPLACGREPVMIRRFAQMGKALDSGSKILHFGWTNEAERTARHQRYVVADGGKFHQSAHLDSIMWPLAKVELEGIEWPAALEPYRERIVAGLDPLAGPLALVDARRAEIEAEWSPEERALAGIWDGVKPDSAPLWWCLDEPIKEKFRPVATERIRQLADEIEQWLAEACA